MNAEIQAYQPALIPQNLKLPVGKVSAMRAYRPGVGMRRNDRLFGNFRHVIKQSIAGMRHIRHDGEPLHLFQCFPSKRG